MAVAVAQTSAGHQELAPIAERRRPIHYLKIRKSLTAGAGTQNCPHSPILLDLNILVLFGGLGFNLKVRILSLLIGVCISMVAGPAAEPPGTIVENYCAASRGQEQSFQGASMDVEIQAALPRLKKQGRLHALRRISALGRITYEKLRFEGDGTVQNQVIARYLTAEAEAQAQKSQAPSLAVTPANYKFKYKSRSQLDGRDVYIFQVMPRQKRQGLFKGDLWIDAGTYLRVQESGYLVKSPSIFLKKVAFVRKYRIRDGISVPLQVQSVVDTRLAGQAELTIDFSNFSIDSARPMTMGDADNQ